MKISVNIECTPEEARSFLGLPDVSAFQKEMLEQVKDRVQASIADLEPEALMKMWMPFGADNWQQMMQSFWQKTGDEK